MRRLMNLLAISLFLTAAACGDDDGDDGADDGTMDDGDDGGTDDGTDDGAAECDVTPAAWAAPEFEANAATALALRAQLEMLNTLMRGAEQETMTVDELADLTALYEAGDPSLAATVSPEFQPIIDEAFADFVALILAGVQDLVDDDGNWTPGASGGIFGAGTRGINAGGIEVRQLVDKGVFGGAGFYRYAVGLTAGEITEATVDALGAAWGGDATMATTEVDFAADYSFEMGFHAEIVAALADAKAYAADESCVEERDEALVTFFRTWEQAMVARTIYYGNSAATTLATAKADDDRASALHQLAEGIGLTVGFIGLEAPASGPLAGGARLLTDEDIEEIAAALGVNLTDLSASTAGDFIQDPPTAQAGIEAVEAIATDVFGLSADDIASYRTPTQG